MPLHPIDFSRPLQDHDMPRPFLTPDLVLAHNPWHPYPPTLDTRSESALAKSQACAMRLVQSGAELHTVRASKVLDQYDILYCIFPVAASMHYTIQSKSVVDLTPFLGLKPCNVDAEKGPGWISSSNAVLIAPGATR